MKAETHIRLATPKDVDNFCCLMRNYRQAMYDNSHGGTANTEQYVRYLIGKETCHCFLCIIDGNPSGFLNIDELPSCRYQSRCAMYLDMWLEVEHRSFENVVRLIRAADEFCVRVGIKVSYLHIEDSLVRLKKLYEYLGWSSTSLLLFKKPI